MALFGQILKAAIQAFFFIDKGNNNKLDSKLITILRILYKKFFVYYKNKTYFNQYEN